MASSHVFSSSGIQSLGAICSCSPTLKLKNFRFILFASCTRCTGKLSFSSRSGNHRPMSTVFRPERRASLKDSWGHPLQPYSLSVSSLMPLLPSSGVSKPQLVAQLWYSQITSGICSAESIVRGQQFRFVFRELFNFLAKYARRAHSKRDKRIGRLSTGLQHVSGEAVHG